MGYYYQGDVGEQFLIAEAIKLDDTNASIWREKGIPYLKRGIAAPYYVNYQKAIQYDAKGWQGWRGYIYLYFYRDYERALADFNATDTLTPDFVDYPQSTSVDFMRAICYLQLGDQDQALDFLDRHIQEELSSVEEKYVDLKAFLFQGIAFHRKGLFEEAAASYKIALRHAPENADLWYWLAKSSLAAGEIAAAKIAIEKADTAFKKGDFNKRNYVEEFFQIYQSDIDNFKKEIQLNAAS